MLQENLTFATPKAVEKALAKHDEIFRYCTFASANIEGGGSDGAFLSCTFRDSEWYWGLFNCALFVDCKFERCTFRGSYFADCRFVECSFVDCRFLHDNLDSSCSAPDTKIYDCFSQNCEGWHELFPHQKGRSN